MLLFKNYLVPALRTKWRLKYNFYSILSQIEPSADNAAANSLDRTLQLRNVRRWRVNVNVTFVTWMLEWAANLSIYVCWIMGPEISKNFMDIMLFWYYLLLPYVHLMNTPYNKDLIIDGGLKTTIRNAFVIPFKYIMRTYVLERSSQSNAKKSNDKENNNAENIVSSDNNVFTSCDNTRTSIAILSNPKSSSFSSQSKDLPKIYT